MKFSWLLEMGQRKGKVYWNTLPCTNWKVSKQFKTKANEERGMNYKCHCRHWRVAVCEITRSVLKLTKKSYERKVQMSAYWNTRLLGRGTPDTKQDRARAPAVPSRLQQEENMKIDSKWVSGKGYFRLPAICVCGNCTCARTYVLWGSLLEIAVFLWQRWDAACYSGCTHCAGCGREKKCAGAEQSRAGPCQEAGQGGRQVCMRGCPLPWAALGDTLAFGGAAQRASVCTSSSCIPHFDGAVVTGDDNKMSTSLADLGKELHAEGETLIAPLRNSSHTHWVQAAFACWGCWNRS